MIKVKLIFNEMFTSWLHPWFRYVIVERLNTNCDQFKNVRFLSSVKNPITATAIQCLKSQKGGFKVLKTL